MTPWTVAHHPFLHGSYILTGSFPGGSYGKESVCNARDVGLIPVLGRSPEKETATHSSIPGESHGQRSLVGYSPELQRVGHD